MQRFQKTVGFVFAVAVLFACPAFGQEQTGEAVSLEKVTVTATKREGAVKDFPGSISVIDDVFMETHGVENIVDMARFAPNVYVKDTSSGGSIVCRGISTIDTSLFSPMGLYVNDVAYPMGYMVNQELFDIERVEVLRGPQGSLYGRNSESGVINIVLREPDNERRHKILTEVGSYNTARLAGSASGPVVEDKLFYGLSLQGKTTEGYYENKFNNDDDVSGERTYNGRTTLRWTPDRDWDVSLLLDGAKRNMNISMLRFEEGPNKTARHEVSVNEADRAHETELGQSIRAKRGWDSVELTSITSHRMFDRDHHLDSDRSAVALGNSEMDVEMDSWSQEFRLATTDADTLSWVLGAYGRHERIDGGIDFNHVNRFLASKRHGNSEDQGYAAFGQATYELVEGLRLTGGMRLDVSRLEGEHSYASRGVTTSYDDDVDATPWLPMASLAYDFTPNITAYSTVSRGFLAGGFNFFSATSKETLAYDAEYSTNYEAGLKTNWLGNALTINATAFRTDIDDKQVRQEVPGAGMGVWEFTNAAEAHTQGMEFEAQYRPIRGLQFNAGVGFADSEVDEWETTSNGAPIDYSGKKLPWAPEYTYNLGASYTHDNGLFAVLDFLGTGRQYFDAANEIKDDGYETANLRLGYQTERIEFSLWCDNLFDEAYAVKKVKNGAGLTMVEDGAPRTYGITLNWRF